MIKLDFLLSIINDLGVFALLAMAYGFILEKLENHLLRGLLVGLVFGLGGCISVLNAYEIVPGVRIDVRSAMLVLAGPFGGIIAAIEAATITGLLRYAQGGIGATAGILNIFATALVGICFIPRTNEAYANLRWKRSLLIGLVSNIPLFFIFMIPIEDPAALYFKVIGPLTVGSVIAVLMLSRILTSATRKVHKRNELVAQATRDPLTGLLNRRGFERQLHPMFSMLKKSGGSSSILVIDIDHFKSVNDAFGHDVGDEILVKVANLVRDQLRRDDIVARFGGEEIVVMMPDVQEREAFAIADRLRQVVESAELLAHHGRPDLSLLTISIGLATRRPLHVGFEEMFKLADKALYQAKHEGRNRVEVNLLAA